MAQDLRDWRWVGDWAGRRASLTPDRIAIRDNTTSTEYTFGEMNRRANRVAYVLLEHGVTKGSRVATYSKNRIEIVDLFLACGKIDAVLVPLNIRLAPPEIEFLVKKTNPKVIAYDQQIKTRFHSLGKGVTGRTVTSLGEPARDDGRDA